MRMTTRGLYGLKAILTLAELSDEHNPVSLQRIAQIEGLSPEFLQQIFYRLRKAGIVKAFRGPGGGFTLNKKLDEISTYDVLFAVGETLEIVPCSLEKTERKPVPIAPSAMQGISGSAWNRQSWNTRNLYICRIFSTERGLS